MREKVRDEYLDHLLAGGTFQAVEMIKRLYENNEMSSMEIYLAITEAMYEVGEKWKRNELSVAQEHVATAITQLVLAQLSEFSLQYDQSNKFEAALFSVETNQHNVGIQIVQQLFQQYGFRTIDYGANVPNESVLGELAKQHPRYIAISIALAQHIKKAAELISLIRSHPLLNQSVVLIGGYVFHQHPELSKKLDYDYFFKDISELEEWLAAMKIKLSM